MRTDPSSVTRDVDEQAHRQWQLSFDMTSHGIALIEPETGRIERVNPAFARMHGGSPTDFVGLPIAATLAAEWRLRADDMAAAVHEQGYVHFECERMRLDGTVFSADVEVLAAREDSGELLYRLAYVTDLSELRAREASERLAVERFERAFEDAPVGMLLVRSGRIERANVAASAIFAREPAELVDCDPRTLVHPEDSPSTEAAQAAVRDGRIPASQDRRIVTPDGRIVHTRLRFTLLHGADAADGPLILVLITDRTAEVEAEQARAAALRLFSTAVDQAPIGMCLVALDGQFLRVNAALCRLFGRSQSDLLATSFQEITHPHDLGADLALVQQCLDGARDHYEIPKRYVRPNGEIVETLLSVALIRTADGRPDHFVSQIMDLTQLHSAEEQLRVVDDRDRIARALHDSCIQRLFAVGLSLEALAVAVSEPSQAQRLDAAIGDIDSTIKGIRSVIYGLRASGVGAGTGVRDRIVGVLEEMTPALGHHPQLRLDGPLEVALPEDLVTELLAVVRDEMSEVAKDRRATRTDVALMVDPSYAWVELEIVDDGDGPVGPDRSAGRSRLARIAEQRGGSCEVDSPVADRWPGRGTRVRLRVPIA